MTRSKDYTLPEQVLYGVGSRDSHALRRSVLRRHRPIAWALSFDYARYSKNEGIAKADQRLKTLDRSLFLGSEDHPILPSAGEREIKDWCEARAKECDLEFAKRFEVDTDGAFQFLKGYVEAEGLDFPLKLFRNMDKREIRLSWLQASKRVTCARWWRRQVKTALRRKLEAVARDIRLVHADKQLYCSDVTLWERQRQIKRNQEILESLEVENDEGQVFTLAQLAEKGLANPRNRFSELVVRSKGFDTVAQMYGHEGRCFTLTCPSKYHRMIKGAKQKDGTRRPCRANGKWNETTPREAHDWLNGIWKKIRSKFNRDDIGYYGFRVVEPHHDGCPHWHMSLYFLPEQADAAEAIIRDYMLEEDGDEQGAQDTRVDSFVIDPEQGATGYLVKYLTKNISGAEGMDKELDFEADGQQKLFVDDTQSRVEAWASCWGIRQFQVLGGPSVTVWRELRRLRTEEQLKAGLESYGGLEDFEVEEIRELHSAADAADWAAFVVLMGGVMIARSDYRLRPWTQTKKEENDYFEPVEELRGLVNVESGRVVTRLRVWTVRVKRKEEDGDEKGEEDKRIQKYVSQAFDNARAQAVEKGSGTEPPWTCVNNCTEPERFAYG
ncbi:replication endonuclease [Endozoicomonas arenosclerae]|uniref:replication endonuclease n=1 Tax=Endozoicomonas arenosclerae TaxID=1633495 RepID=UPI000784F5A7|nr:replication endonuclease [Endozoicomonas arenosclerae]